MGQGVCLGGPPGPVARVERQPRPPFPPRVGESRDRGEGFRIRRAGRGWFTVQATPLRHGREQFCPHGSATER